MCIRDRLRQCAHPGGAAICGAMLWYPDETIQHAGIVTGLGGYAGHSHKYKKKGGSGYPVSYTHLDVYKRQDVHHGPDQCPARDPVLPPAG